MKSLLLSAAALAVLAACSGTNPVTNTASALESAVSAPLSMAQVETNKANAVAGLKAAFVDLDVDALDTYFAEPYIQHNPLAQSGLAAFKGLVGSLPAPLGVDVHRVIGDGDLVALHSTYTGFGPSPLVAFDVFRFDAEGKIVEHWDNMLPVAAPNPSGRTQTDGTTAIIDRDRTEANKAKIAEFIDRSLIKHEEVDITDYISPVTYIQHNPMVADGLDGFGAFMAQMAEQGVTMEYAKVHKVMGEGNFVLAMSEGALGGKPKAFYDLFRLENGLIVEHWDVIADMPGADVPAGYPGKF